MTTPESLLAAVTPVDGTSVLSPALGPGVAALLARCYAGQPVVLTGASARAEGDAVVLTGTSGFLGVADLAVVATLAVDTAGDVSASVDYAMVDPAGGGWRFSRSFPTLPVVGEALPAAAGATPTVRPFLDVLELAAPHCTVRTSPTPAIEVSATLADGLSSLVGAVFGTAVDLRVRGTITPPVPGDATAPLAPGVQPWELDAAPPGVQLDLPLPGPLTLDGGLALERPTARVYCPPSSDWLAENDTFAPVVGLTGTLVLPTAGVSIDVSAVVDRGAGTLLLRGQPHGVSIGHLAALADLTGTAGLADALPPALADAVGDLGALELLAVSARLALSGGAPRLASTAVTVGLPPGAAWSVLDGVFTVADLAVGFTVADPLTAPRLGVAVSGTITVAGVDVAVSATAADGFTVLAEVDDVTIPLCSLMATHLPAVPVPADLVVDDLAITIVPGSSYSLAADLAADPHPWVVDVGVGSLTFHDLALLVEHTADGPVTGHFSGRVGFGEVAELELSYDVPGELALRGTFPSISLSSLVHTLCGDVLALPVGFDLELVDTAVLLRSGAAGWDFRAATTVSGAGVLALEVRRTGAGWGVAAGLDLGGGTGAVDGIPELGEFERLFGLDRLVLVVSTFADPGFDFGDVAAHAPALPAAAPALPASSGGLVPGFTLYGRWQVDPTDPAQGLLRGLLGLDSELDVLLQVGTGAARSIRLAARYVGTLLGHPLHCEFGGQLGTGGIGFFLTGSMDVAIEGQIQRFDLALVFVDNGAFASASMTGTTPVSFQGLQLANLALQIGVSWEGLPALGVTATLEAGFEASIAVFFNAAHPSQSLLAGSLSDLTLRDVLVDLAGVDPPDVLAPVLGAIGVKGTHAFTVDGELGADLDALRFDRLAAAFRDRAGIALATSASELLVDRAEDGTRWYLTDMTTMRHYQLVRTTGGIEVSVEAQIYLAPQVTRIGSTDFPQGFYLNGALSILGIRSESTIEVDPGRGISVDSSTDRIVIGSESLFVLEAAQGTAGSGPSLSMATYDQPRHPDERFRAPHVYINGDVGLLGLRRGLYVQVGKDGAAFELVGSLLPGAEFDLHGRFTGLTDFELGGSISVGLGRIDLGPLGTVSLATGATAAVDVLVAGSEITATLDATFTFAGEEHTAHVVLDVDTAPFAAPVELLTERVAAWFRDLFADAARWLRSVRDGALTLVTSVGQVLGEQFGATADAAARLLRGAGWAVDEVAHELKEAFALGSTLARDALAAAGYAADEVGAVMRSVFEWTDEIVQAADEALDGFFQDVSDTFTDRRVTMVLLNRTGHRLRVEGARGESDQIEAREGLEIVPGGADEIGYFRASTGRWVWVDVRDVDDDVPYQAFIKEDSWFENATKSARLELRDAQTALPAGAVAAVWNGSSTASYVFDRVPAAFLRPPLSFPVGRRYAGPDGRAVLVFQADGNLVVYDEQDIPRWYTDTVASGGRTPGATCVLQQDGNLVVYDAGGHPLWASHTPGHPDAVLALQIDGDVVLLADGWKALWTSGTHH